MGAGAAPPPATVPTAPSFPSPSWQAPAPPYSAPPYTTGGWTPPGQPYVPGYPPTPYPYYAPSAPSTPPKRRTGLIVGIVAAVAVVLVLVCSGTAFALLSLRQPTAALAPSATQVAGLATLTPTPTSSSPLLYQTSFASDVVGWSDDTRCHLGPGGYHVVGAECSAPVGDQSDVDVTAQVKQLTGPPTYLYGIALRRVGRDKRYDIGIDSNGEWFAIRCIGVGSDGRSANCERIVSPKANAAIHRGLGVSNTIEVRAQGHTFQVYVNGTQVGMFTDAAYAIGELGLTTHVDMEAVFSQMTVKLIS